MKQLTVDHIPYSLLLIAIVSSSEYAIMQLLSQMQIAHTLSQKTAAITDSLLLIVIAAGPIFSSSSSLSSS